MERELTHLREVFARGENLTRYLTDRYGAERSRAEIIEYAYDLQAGSYVTALARPGAVEHKRRWAAEVARVVDGLDIRTVCDAGTGEATTLAFILEALPSARAVGFDISLSRLLVARTFLGARAAQVEALFAAELGAVPLAGGACDLVMTHHALEPNHGREDELVRELARVTRRYLLLVEPSWELADAEQRARMEHHGYVRGLPAAVERAGLRVLRHGPWPHDANPANRAAVLLAEKPTATSSLDFAWASPITRLPLRSVEGGLYCDGDGFFFPTVGGVPVLRRERAVLATRYGDLCTSPG